jgi:hypothetical protein
MRMKCYVQSENEKEQELHLLSPWRLELNFVDRWGLQRLQDRKNLSLGNRNKRRFVRALCYWNKHQPTSIKAVRQF